jgi:hypothetical protein
MICNCYIQRSSFIHNTVHILVYSKNVTVGYVQYAYTVRLQL